MKISGLSEDQSMWLKFLDGDIRAFEHLMTDNFRNLFHYGCKFSENEEFVKDSIQDLFLNLWEKRHGLSADIPAKPYLMASLRRMMHRSSTIQKRLYGESDDRVSTDFDVEFSVEQRYIESESTHLRSVRLQQHLNELPARQREVMYLKYFQEMDRAQIAEIMGISPQTVSNLMQIALAHLKKYFTVELLIVLLMNSQF